MLIQLVAHADWLSLASLSITGIGIVCSLWMILDCYRDLHVVTLPSARCPWPEECCQTPALRRELAIVHLRNEWLRLAAQVTLGLIVVVTVAMPPMLPEMRDELLDHPLLPWFLLARMALRVVVSLLLMLSAVLELRYRHRVHSGIVNASE